MRNKTRDRLFIALFILISVVNVGFVVWLFIEDFNWLTLLIVYVYVQSPVFIASGIVELIDNLVDRKKRIKSLIKREEKEKEKRKSISISTQSELSCTVIDYAVDVALLEEERQRKINDMIELKEIYLSNIDGYKRNIKVLEEQLSLLGFEEREECK